MAFDKEAYRVNRAAEKEASAARAGQSRAPRETKKVVIPPTTLVCGPCMDDPATKARAWRGPFVKRPGSDDEYYHQGCPHQGRRV